MTSKIPSKEELTSLINQGKTNIEIGKIYKKDPSTVSKWKSKLEIKTENKIEKTPNEKIISTLNDGILNIDSFSIENNISKSIIYGILEEIEKNGAILEKSASGYYINKSGEAQNKIHQYFKNKLKFGAIGDTHLCSKEQQLTHLNTMYDIFEKEGITEVYHTGDLLAGDGVYKGQRFETFFQSADDQVQYCIEKYPQRKNIKTFFITGNHDFSFYKSSGVDVGKTISRERKDMIYLGQLGAYINLKNNIKMHILHPDGGGSYARSYKPQKLIENYSSENKPNIALFGHYHTSLFFHTRNVFSLTTGCFEGQTPFLLRKGLHPEVGGFLTEITQGEFGPLRVKAEFIPFPKIIYKDY
jgi:predicted phosphodiesterase